MNCNEFQTALEQSIEDRVSLGAEAARHVEVCGSSRCRMALAEAGLIDRAISRWTAQVPEVDIADDVLGRLGREVAPVERQPSERHTAAAGGRAWQLVAAAAVLVGASIALLSPGGGPSDRPVAARPAPTGVQLASASQAQEISRRYVSWAHGTSSLVADAVGVVLPVGSSQTSSNSMSMPEMPSSWFKRLESAQREFNEAIMFLEDSVRMNPNPAT
jgi:hypothetical protein